MLPTTIQLKPLNLVFEETTQGAGTYYLDGKAVDRISDVLNIYPKPWLLAWPPKEMEKYIHAKLDELLPRHTILTNVLHQQIKQIVTDGKSAWRVKRDKSADIGTQAHDILSVFIKTGQRVVPKNAQVQNCVDRFFDWLKENKVEWLLSEQKVASMEHGFAGTCDAAGILNGKVALIDFKTSNQMSDSFDLQTAAYQLALEEMGFPKIEERWILRFPKEGEDFEVKKVRSLYESDKHHFLCILAHYRCLKGKKNGTR